MSKKLGATLHSDALVCVPVLFMRSLCEPYRTTVVQLFRAMMLLASQRLWKTVAFRLCSSRFGAILWPSAKRGGIPTFSGGMPAELFERVVMEESCADRRISTPLRGREKPACDGR
jgi:hypothetical protein